MASNSAMVETEEKVMLSYRKNHNIWSYAIHPQLILYYGALCKHLDSRLRPVSKKMVPFNKNCLLGYNYILSFVTVKVFGAPDSVYTRLHFLKI